jgi:ribosomal protein L40E
MAESMLCTQCGAVTTPRAVTPGSMLITLVLLVCIVVPGVIYMIWRHTSRYAVCQKCGSKNLVPIDSPFGRDMIATRPSVAASLAEENRGRNDMVVGGLVLAGIVVLVILIAWLRS